MIGLRAPAGLLRRAPRAQARDALPADIPRAGSPAATPAPSRIAPAPATTLRIDRLVLDAPALGPLQAAQLRSALERELAALLQGQPLSPASHSQDRLRAPALSATSASPAGLGRAIARSLHAGLAGPGARPA